MRLLAAFITAILAVSAGSVHVFAKDIALVVNKANSTKVLTLPELTKLFKTATKKWPDGREVMLVLPDLSSPDMKLVIQKVYGMSADDVKALAASANQSRQRISRVRKLERCAHQNGGD